MRALVPLKVNALPYFPEVVQVAAVILPLLLLPDTSAAEVPLPSLNAYAAIKPLGAAGVTAVAVPEYGLGFPAASLAPTR